MIFLIYGIQHQCSFEPNLFTEVQTDGTLWKSVG